MAERSSFGPILALGVGGAVLVAVAGTKAWATYAGTGAAAVDAATGGAAGQMPLATTLALVVLAAWGVVLVTRGRVRRAVAVLGALASIGVLATVVSGWWLVPQTLRDAAADAGLDTVTLDVAGWFWVALVGAVLSAGATVLAVFRVGGWPEMGTRYDSPEGGPATTPAEEPSHLDLWKSLDHGQDPTV